MGLVLGGGWEDWVSDEAERGCGVEKRLGGYGRDIEVRAGRGGGTGWESQSLGWGLGGKTPRWC